MAFIRRYRPSDFDAAAHICRATLPPSLSASPAATRLAPFLWTHQYTHLSPDTCFILDDGSGKAVGYCIGCPSVLHFTSAGFYGRYIADILDPSSEIKNPTDLETLQSWNLADGSVNGECLAQLAYNPIWLLVDGREEVIAQWSATLHIDMLPAYQGKGWGKSLINEFVDSVKEKEGFSGGVHIAIAGENGNVVGFYEKCGFRGIEGGQKTHTIWMVRDV